MSMLIEVTTSAGPLRGVRVDCVYPTRVDLSLPEALVDQGPAVGERVTLRWPAGHRGRYALPGHVAAAPDGSHLTVIARGTPDIEQQRQFVRAGGGEQVKLLTGVTEESVHEDHLDYLDHLDDEDHEVTDGADGAATSELPEGEQAAESAEDAEELPEPIVYNGWVRDLSEQGIAARFEEIYVTEGEPVRLQLQLDNGMLDVGGHVLRITKLPDTGPKQLLKIDVVVLLEADEAKRRVLRRYVFRHQLLTRARTGGEALPH